MEEINYDIMRYDLDDNGYILNVYFGCSSGTCTGYTGEIPEGYETLEEWYEDNFEIIRAWKIVDGNLAFDTNRCSALETQFEKEAEDNRYVCHKELEGITSTPQSLKDLYDGKKVIGEIVTFDDGSDLEINKINIKPLEELTNEINLTITGANMLPNEFTTLKQDGVTFTQNKDKSIAINGTVSNDIEVNLAGTSTSTNYILTFKKGITYKLSGLVDNVYLNFYCFDGTDRELVLTSGNGEITLDTDKHITQITISVKPTYTKRNVQVGDDLSGKTLYFDFYKGFYEILNPESTVNVIRTSTKRITEFVDSYLTTTEKSVGIHNGDKFYHSIKTDTSEPVETILTEYTLPSDFGTVTTINTDSASYEYIFIEEETPIPVTFKNTIYPMLSMEEKEYEPYNGSHYKINLGSNVVSSQELYPNMVYPSDNIYPSAYHYVTIEDGEVTLYQGNDEISLNNIAMPSTLIGNNTIYTHQDTRIMVNYIVGGTIATRNIHLEGYTTINNGFSVDLEGNMTCNNATMNGARVTGGNIELESGTKENPTFRIAKNDTDYALLFSDSLLFENEESTTYIDKGIDFRKTEAEDSGYYYGAISGNEDGCRMEIGCGENSAGCYVSDNYNYMSFVSGPYETINLDGTDGSIKCETLSQRSLEEYKKNIELFEEGLSIINNTDIYKYHFKTQNDDEKKHIGFVIGEDRKYSSEITAVDKMNKEIGVDTYSMVSVCFNAIKELNNKIEQLENKIKELESDDNGEN